MTKIYKKIKYNKAWIIAKIEKFNNEKYGFSTSTDKGKTFERNINMPFFDTEADATKWIESNKDWQ